MSDVSDRSDMSDEAGCGAAERKIEHERGLLTPPNTFAIVLARGDAGRGTARESEEEDMADPIELTTGRLDPSQVDLMLTRLPVDVTFVDEYDVVRYFTGRADRVFFRPPAIVGKRVQDCHPAKSLDVVEKILRAFKAGERDEAEFWIETEGKFIHIRYLALRDRDRRYRGTVEVTLDATRVRGLRGERRLLDWK